MLPGRDREEDREAAEGIAGDRDRSIHRHGRDLRRKGLEAPLSPGRRGRCRHQGREPRARLLHGRRAPGPTEGRAATRAATEQSARPAHDRHREGERGSACPPSARCRRRRPAGRADSRPRRARRRRSAPRRRRRSRPRSRPIRRSSHRRSPSGVVSIPALGTSFLYTGADPVQTGVAAGTIDARRAAVLRGRVLTTAGAPIAGVTIDIQGHPRLGTTRTQLDGGFDLVANGGGPLTVRYRKDGLLAVTRELDVPWQQFVMVAGRGDDGARRRGHGRHVRAERALPDRGLDDAERWRRYASHAAALSGRDVRAPGARGRQHAIRGHAAHPRHRVHGRRERPGRHAGGAPAAQRLHVLYGALRRRGDRGRRDHGRVRSAGHRLHRKLPRLPRRRRRAARLLRSPARRLGGGA